MIKTAILMAGDNIHARILVDEMKRAGKTPDLIINEMGTERAEKLAQFLKNDYHNPPSVTTTKTEYHEVKQFDGEESLKIIKERNPSYLIIAGCGTIIKKNILSLTTPLNVHPGLLPQVRGLDPVLWSVEHNIPVGATVHIMDEGIDTGDILIAKPMPWQGAKDILELRLQCIRWGGKLLAEFLKNPQMYKPQKQNENLANYYAAYPKEKYTSLEQRYAEGDGVMRGKVKAPLKSQPADTGGMYFLSGKKVGLRAMTREDLPLYQSWLNDKTVTKYLEMGWRPYTSADLEEVYQEAVSGKSIVFVVCELATNKPIGTAGFYLIHWPGRRAQYRILLGEPSLYGKGYGTEVNDLLVEYGFNRLNLNTIYLGVNAENTGAIRSYEKSGFVHEGVLRQFVYNDGQYYDSICMSILADEYAKNSK